MLALEKAANCGYNGLYSVTAMVIVLSADFTHHRGMAGCNPLCPAAYLRFRFGFTPSDTELQGFSETNISRQKIPTSIFRGGYFCMRRFCLT